MAVVEETKDRVWQSVNGEQIPQVSGIGGEGWDYYIDISNLRIPGTVWKLSSESPTMDFTLPISYNIDSYDFKISLKGVWGFCTGVRNGWTGYSNNDFVIVEGSSNKTSGIIAPGGIKVADKANGTATKTLKNLNIELRAGYSIKNCGKAFDKNSKMSKSSTYYRSVVQQQNWEDTKVTAKRMTGTGINLTFTNGSYIKNTIYSYKSNSKGKFYSKSTYSNIFYRGFTGSAIDGAKQACFPAILIAGPGSKIFLKPKELTKDM